jgi:MFS family permease
VYILTTLFFTEMTSRARAFGAISAMGGIGAAAGPLLGGLITATMGWRAAFGIQALIIVLIVLLARRIKDPLPADPPAPSTPEARSCPPWGWSCWSLASWPPTPTDGSRWP